MLIMPGGLGTPESVRLGLVTRKTTPCGEVGTSALWGKQGAGGGVNNQPCLHDGVSVEKPNLWGLETLQIGKRAHTRRGR